MGLDSNFISDRHFLDDLLRYYQHKKLGRNLHFISFLFWLTEGMIRGFSTPTGHFSRFVKKRHISSGHLPLPLSDLYIFKV